MDIPLSKAVFDMVEGRVHKNSRVIPCARFDTDSFVDEGVLGEVLVRDGDRVLAEQSYLCTVRAPDNILDGRRVELSKRLLLLDIEQNDRGGRGKNEARGATVEDFVRLNRRLDSLHHRTGQVANFDELFRR